MNVIVLDTRNGTHHVVVRFNKTQERLLNFNLSHGVPSPPNHFSYHFSSSHYTLADVFHSHPRTLTSPTTFLSLPLSLATRSNRVAFNLRAVVCYCRKAFYRSRRNQQCVLFSLSCAAIRCVVVTRKNIAREK